MENFNPSIKTRKSDSGSFTISFSELDHQAESHPPIELLVYKPETSKNIQILLLPFDAFQV